MVKLQYRGRAKSPFAVYALAGLPAAEQHGPSAAAGKHQHAAGVPPPAARSVLLEPACQCDVLQSGSV